MPNNTIADFESLGWKRCNDRRRGNTSFRRPLGPAELQFYWDNVFNGIGTTIGHIVLEAEPDFEYALFSNENVELAWMRMKQRFPLLGASVEELPGSETVDFVLDERSLCSIRTGEVNYSISLESMKDVTRLTDEFQNGPPVLSNEIIAKLWIGPQRDAPRVFHAFIVAAHYITDGITGAILLRELSQELASLSKEKSIIGKSLEDRLANLRPVEALNPNNKLSRARRRWQLAAAKVIHTLRQSKLKGGHTLPTICAVDSGIPALSRTLVVRLSISQTKRVMDTCRSLGITFGNALPVLSQVAHAQVLYKCCRSMVIRDEELEYRRTQPMHFVGPIDLRPYLDSGWFDAGGASEVCMAIGSYRLILPSMPNPKPDYDKIPNFIFSTRKSVPLARWLEGPRDVNCFVTDDPIADGCEPYEVYGTNLRSGNASSLISLLAGDGEPCFSSLLSRERFMLRARMIRAQSSALLRHPLLLELQAAHMQELCHSARALGLGWRTKQTGSGGGVVIDSTAPRKANGYVVSNGGASLGITDLLLPLDYPLRSPPFTTPTRLHIRDSIVHLRCRPGELYLGAFTSQGQLTFFTYVDAHVYDLNLVREWMEDVRAATIHYLEGESGGVIIDARTFRVTKGMNEGSFGRAKL